MIYNRYQRSRVPLCGFAAAHSGKSSGDAGDAGEVSGGQAPSQVTSAGATKGEASPIRSPNENLKQQSACAVTSLSAKRKIELEREVMISDDKRQLCKKGYTRPPTHYQEQV